MADYTLVAQLVRAIHCGAKSEEDRVLPNGALFVNETAARVFKEKHDKEFLEIKETAPFQWFAKNKPGKADDDDGIIKAIEKAVADAKL